MVIRTRSPRVDLSRKLVLELLASSVDLSTAPTLEPMFKEYGADPNRFGKGETVEQPVKIDNDLYVRDYAKCILCYQCVDACVAAHDDGRTRLYLDGPRFENYLVPISCRSCLDPVCMIGCPVGSINRGDKGEIVIENWCIGCGMCVAACKEENRIPEESEFSRTWIERHVDTTDLRQHHQSWVHSCSRAIGWTPAVSACALQSAAIHRR